MMTDVLVNMRSARGVYTVCSWYKDILRHMYIEMHVMCSLGLHMCLFFSPLPQANLMRLSQV